MSAYPVSSSRSIHQFSVANMGPCPDVPGEPGSRLVTLSILSFCDISYVDSQVEIAYLSLVENGETEWCSPTPSSRPWTQINSTGIGQVFRWNCHIFQQDKPVPIVLSLLLYQCFHFYLTSCKALLGASYFFYWLSEFITGRNVLWAHNSIS